MNAEDTKSWNNADTTMFDRYPQTMKDRFKKFHSENPHVYEEFKRLAFKMKATGRTKYSATAIVNVLRWETDLKTKGDVFQINNDFISIYVRLIIWRYPEMVDFFELREMPNRGIKSAEQRERESEKNDDPELGEIPRAQMRHFELEPDDAD